MNGKIDWKSKYMELRSKYMNAIDVAFRLGHEEGAREAEMENLQMQVQEMEEQAAMAEQEAMMGEEPMVDEEGMPIEEEMPMEEGMEGEEMGMEGEGNELDDSINELESFVKEEKFDVTQIMKSMHETGDVKVLENDKVNKINELMKKIDK